MSVETTTIKITGTSDVYKIDPPKQWSKEKVAHIGMGYALNIGANEGKFLIFSQYGRDTACLKQNWRVGTNLRKHKVLIPGSPEILSKHEATFDEVHNITLEDISDPEIFTALKKWVESRNIYQMLLDCGMTYDDAKEYYASH